jgi:hypothetical protein
MPTQPLTTASGRAALSPASPCRPTAGSSESAIAAAHHGPDTLLVVPGYEHALQLLDGPHSHRINTAID